MKIPVLCHPWSAALPELPDFRHCPIMELKDLEPDRSRWMNWLAQKAEAEQKRKRKPK